MAKRTRKKGFFTGCMLYGVGLRRPYIRPYIYGARKRFGSHSCGAPYLWICMGGGRPYTGQFPSGFGAERRARVEECGQESQLRRAREGSSSHLRGICPTYTSVSSLRYQQNNNNIDTMTLKPYSKNQFWATWARGPTVQF